MSPNRPYLIRAMHEWISDNHCTPYLLVNAKQQGVQVPTNAVKDGQIVLNIAMRAVAALDMGNEWIRFTARFSGTSHPIEIPVSAVMAIYAQENGQGMMFPAEQDAIEPPVRPDPVPAGGQSTRLRVIK